MHAGFSNHQPQFEEGAKRAAAPTRWPLFHVTNDLAPGVSVRVEIRPRGKPLSQNDDLRDSGKFKVPPSWQASGITPTLGLKYLERHVVPLDTEQMRFASSLVP